MRTVGVPELILFLVAALLGFGQRKLREIGKSSGKALAEYRLTPAEADPRTPL